jgi:hypothetical protein
MKAERGSKGIAYSFFNLGRNGGVGAQRLYPAALPRERDKVPILQGGWRASRPVWRVAENLAPLGFDP